MFCERHGIYAEQSVQLNMATISVCVCVCVYVSVLCSEVLFVLILAFYHVTLDDWHVMYDQREHFQYVMVAFLLIWTADVCV